MPSAERPSGHPSAFGSGAPGAAPAGGVHAGAPASGAGAGAGEPSAPAPDSFVLFDPVDAPARLYRGAVGHRVARGDADLPGFLAWADAELAAGRELALFLGFEAARGLAGLPVRHAPGAPLAEGLSFGAADTVDDVDAWLDAQAAPGPAGFASWRREVSRADYDAALADIAERIACGEIYQVNHTFGMRARVFGDPLRLYRALRRRQPTPQRCLARLADGWLLGLSPETFFELDPGGAVRTRPMKGTAPRDPDPARDAAAARALAASAKDRAENLMILDLLRNDLGRIARPGSVTVPERFAVEAHAGVWQMTSSVTATLRPGLDWAALWAALFPCGSVVGAPKHRAMAVIGGLESGPRGLYTGAAGWIAPSRGAAPDQATARFSVLIRSVTVDAVRRAGTRVARLGVGSGVVADSVAADEWRECLLKAGFATGLDPGFGLIETFVARGDAVEPHLERLARSARVLGFRLDRAALRRAIAAAQAGHGPAPLRTRVELRHDGRVDLAVAPLTPLAPGPVGVMLAEDLGFATPLDPDDPLLRHKTTARQTYDAAWRAAEARGAFDALFFNRRGELCEGGRSSVFLRLDGRWWTPPLRCGLLPGVARAAVLARGAAAERVLRREDLLAAEAIMLTNALRGEIAARL